MTFPNGPSIWVTSLTASGATSEGNLEKIFQVKPGGQLTVAVDSGPIAVVTSDRPEVQVQVKRKVGGTSEDEAKKIFALHEVSFSQDGAQLVYEAVDAADCQRECIRATDPHRGGTERQGLEDIGAAADAAVDKYGHPAAARGHHLRKTVDCRA